MIAPTAELVAELVDVYRRHTPTIRLLPDAARLIARLDGRYLGVVTEARSTASVPRRTRSALQLGRQLIVYTAELGPGFGKPHQLAFSMHEDRAGLAGPEFTYIADNPTKDFAGPKSLGWATIRIRRPESLHAERASGRDVDREIVSLDELAP